MKIKTTRKYSITTNKKNWWIGKIKITKSIQGITCFLSEISKTTRLSSNHLLIYHARKLKERNGKLEKRRNCKKKMKKIAKELQTVEAEIDIIDEEIRKSEEQLNDASDGEEDV